MLNDTAFSLTWITICDLLQRHDPINNEKILFSAKFDVFLQPINENKGNNLGAINLSRIEVNVRQLELNAFSINEFRPLFLPLSLFFFFS